MESGNSALYCSEVDSNSKGHLIHTSIMYNVLNKHTAAFQTKIPVATVVYKLQLPNHSNLSCVITVIV